MPLTIICITGPGNTGKTSTIREFTHRYVGYARARGDVLGIFQMPRRGYAIGISSSGDALKFILKGQKFLTRYDGLRGMIVASRSDGKTFKAVEAFAKSKKATLHIIRTKHTSDDLKRKVAIAENAKKIKNLLPN